jgi:DNA-binding GntR family transcriptional regulator
MQIFERNKKETAREYAMRTLTHNITHLHLEPGCMVSEKEISSQLNLSRTPVREALIELAKIGIVEVLPQCGSRVSLVNYELVEEARFLRLVLEKAVVDLACELADRLDFSELNDNLRLQQFCAENDYSDKLLELDDGFHQELFHLCNKDRTYQFMRSMTTHFDRVRILALRLGPVKDLKTVDDHIAIAVAIQQGDAQKAVELMNTHLSRYKFDAVGLQKMFPEYFPVR